MEALIAEMLDGRILLAEAVDEFEKIYILQALGRNGGRRIRTADALGIHRNTLSAKLAEYKSSEPVPIPKSGSRSLNIKKNKPVKRLKARAAGSTR